MIISKVRRGKRIDHFETERQTRDWHLVQISLSVLPILDEAGIVVGASKITRDISGQKKTEALLREVSHRRDEFMNNMSHELRTPMNAVLGLTHILSLSDDLTPKQTQCLTVLKHSADNLMGLIDNLLDFAKLESGALELETSDVDLSAL